jgi:hypothetical protein
MATLTVSITEEVYLNGSNRGSVNTLSITGVNDVMQRAVTVPASIVGTTDLIAFDTNPGGAVFTPGNMRYLRVTNIDTASPPASLILNVQTATNEFNVKLDGGESFIISNKDLYATTGINTTPTYTDIALIRGAGVGSSNCAAEIFVASA